MILLKKATSLVSNTDLFFSDPQNGVTALLEALPHCRPPLVLKLLPLLGYAGKDRVLWPLYQLIIQPDQDEQVRISAAIQLGTAASLSRDPSTTIMLLMDHLDCSDLSVRSCCALALGWEGNNIAVNHLLSHLDDPDRDFQAAVVTALAAIGSVQVFNMLKDRLKKGSVEEKRSIVLNLWRFMEKTPQVENVYLDIIDPIEPELKLDLITGMGMIPLSDKILVGYRRLLREKDGQIRNQVLKNLSTFDPADYQVLTKMLVELAEDEEDSVRQLAIRLLSKR